MITVVDSRAISNANDTEQQAQVAVNSCRGRFSTETPLERERRLEIKEQRRRRRQQETAEKRENRLAQRRQHRQQEKDTCTDSCTGAAIKYCNYNANEGDKERKHRLQKL